jgi:AcrR family transcriptional regulator
VITERRQTLLSIGERLFSSRGYRDVSVKDIAGAAGMGAASFYTYFPGKAAFYREILTGREKRHIQEIGRHVEGFKSPLNKLKTLFRSVIGNIRADRILHGFYAGEKRYACPGMKADGPGRGRLLAFIEELLGRILSEGTRKGSFRTDVFRNPHRMLMVIFGAMLTNRDSEMPADLIIDMALLTERGMKRWLRLRMRDERLDRRAARIP